MFIVIAFGTKKKNHAQNLLENQDNKANSWDLKQYIKK